MKNTNKISNLKTNENFSSKKLETRLILACILSNLSQIPHNSISEVSKALGIGMWFIVLFSSLLLFREKIKLNGLFYLIPLFLFDTLIIIMQFFSGVRYISSSLMYPVHLSAFIFIINYICGQFLSEKSFIKIMNYYVLSALIVGIYIFFTSFFGADWITSSVYTYTSKNSISQILLFAAISVFIYGFFNKKFLKVPIILILLSFTFILQSRAVLVGLFIVILYSVFFVMKNNLLKCWSVLFLVVCVLLVFTLEPLYDFFIERILLNNRIDEGLNAISSGRINHLFKFIEKFGESPIFGNGPTRIESFPLSSLASFGIFAGLILIIFAMMPFFIGVRDIIKRKRSDMLYILIMFAFVALSNCIFEEQAPFGPGVKCYLLWMVAGIYTGMKKREKLQ